jgi:hypothetical protein
MENLVIKGEKNTFFIPTVDFSADSGVCVLKGESYLEDTFNFYQRLENWLKEYTALRKPLTFNIGLSYFNTASSRSILDMLMILKQYEESGGQVAVNWKLENWDDDMKQEIEDFSADSGLTINVD